MRLGFGLRPGAGTAGPPAGAVKSPADNRAITDPRPGFEGRYITVPAAK